MIAQAHKDTVSRFSRITGCIRTSRSAEPRKAQGYINKQHVSYESSKMPKDYENETPVAAIDWDEFHQTSPYDAYVPRGPPRKKWSIVLGILLYLVAQFSVSLFLPPILIALGIITSSEELGTSTGTITAGTYWLLNVANIVSIALIVAIVLGFYKERLSSCLLY